MLDVLGYRVLAAGTPSQAIQLAAEHPGQIALLITDVVMPGMNGVDLAVELTSRWPELRTLYISGYTGNALVGHGVLEECVHLLPKPFSKQELADQVRFVLDLPGKAHPGTSSHLQG